MAWLICYSKWPVMNEQPAPTEAAAGEPASSEQPYQGLDPDTILHAVESTGRLCDGSQLALNSYENRVYQIGLEDAAPIVVKFYRPGRWTDAAIAEEHEFARELGELDIPVVEALADQAGRTLFEYSGYRFSLYPRRGGRHADLGDLDNLFTIGRLVGRIHAVGATRDFQCRPTLDIESFGYESVRYLAASGFIPEDLYLAWTTTADDVLLRVSQAFARVGDIKSIRLHGDFHAGNLLWTDDGPHFVDFDDCRMGPAVQDLWMMLSGDRSEMTGQLAEILDGYNEFCDFDPRELHLVESMRSLRMIYHSAWLARRWNDPAFPRAFPWFNANRYWEEQILGLREQAALLTEPPLEYN